ncbi:hypothetical protein [Thermoanaerobacterium thermosaccharolyticum]|uniref:hypothetical protein n=1 Tax=Thermoanaerobacterium thermosaccharolyticum TaxID=1517 RepID=UPI00177FC7FB|nr:hypothetical protein [Thermoanaerobacterium thermosaccharolyticum]MBE0069850.1 hypothetical protein [Thermoanaerobacterium thermosaccharolyticum]MBE0227485.1 hypothetical protein [Thermoanaerobacterium thermosaccharolyticum]
MFKNNARVKVVKINFKDCGSELFFASLIDHPRYSGSGKTPEEAIEDLENKIKRYVEEAKELEKLI